MPSFFLRHNLLILNRKQAFCKMSSNKNYIEWSTKDGTKLKQQNKLPTLSRRTKKNQLVALIHKTLAFLARPKIQNFIIGNPPPFFLVFIWFTKRREKNQSYDQMVMVFNANHVTKSSRLLGHTHYFPKILETLLGILQMFGLMLIGRMDREIMRLGKRPILQAGVAPYNGFSLEHKIGTKTRGTTFDIYGYPNDTWEAHWAKDNQGQIMMEMIIYTFSPSSRCQLNSN
ncbi:hypothetical protein RJ641_009659 [Dillenia turbinata]|uniref:Uncharacterized protein n=1 Tax=Dillenia turbinata TaxID=194707 RepID=A0AAN8VCV0_9MAGN